MEMENERRRRFVVLFQDIGTGPNYSKISMTFTRILRTSSPYGSGDLFRLSIGDSSAPDRNPLPCRAKVSATLVESRRRGPNRAPAPALGRPLAALRPAEPGWVEADGGRLFAEDGDGDGCDALFANCVWTDGGGGRFSF